MRHENRFKRVAYRIVDKMSENSIDEANRVWSEFNERFGHLFVGKPQSTVQQMVAVQGEFEDIVHVICG